MSTWILKGTEFNQSLLSAVIMKHHFSFVTQVFLLSDSANHDLISLTEQSAPDAPGTKQGMASTGSASSKGRKMVGSTVTGIRVTEIKRF